MLEPASARRRRRRNGTNGGSSSGAGVHSAAMMVLVLVCTLCCLGDRADAAAAVTGTAAALNADSAAGGGAPPTVSLSLSLSLAHAAAAGVAATASVSLVVLLCARKKEDMTVAVSEYNRTNSQAELLVSTDARSVRAKSGVYSSADFSGLQIDNLPSATGANDTAESDGQVSPRGSEIRGRASPRGSEIRNRSSTDSADRPTLRRKRTFTALPKADSPIEIEFADMKMKKELGRGHHGAVFRATFNRNVLKYRDNDTPLAIKQLKFRESVDDRRIDALRKTAERVVAVPPSPHTVAVIGVCTHPRTPLSVVRRYYPQSLAQALADADAELTLSTVAQWSLELAQGLAYLYSHGIVHGRLHAANVMLDRGDGTEEALMERGRCMITDYGDFTAASHIDANDPIVRWAPADVLDNYALLDAKTDTYMWGMTLVEILCRAEPYAEIAEHRDVFGRRVLLEGAAPLAPPAVPAHVVPELEQVIRAATNADPADRPSMLEIEASLRSLMGL